MIDFYSLSVLVFLAVLLVLIWKDRKNIEIKYIVLIRRTKRGRRILDKIARYRLFWKLVGIVSIIVSFYLIFEGMSMLLLYAKASFEGIVKIPALSFILPSPKPRAEMGPGYILIPFWFWIFAVLSIVFPHEIFHGIMSRVEKVKIKSAGFILFLFLPGAFVEPDERQLRKLGLLAKLRIFSAGSFANFLVYLLLFSLVSYVVWPMVVPGPIKLIEVNETGPAYLAGLRKGMVIEKIRGRVIDSSYEEFLSGKGYLQNEMEGAKPGEEIEIIANGTSFKVVLGSNPNNSSLPYLGITYTPVLRYPNISWVIIQLLTWTWSINYAVAVFNLLPIYPLDGGLIVEAFSEKLWKKNAKKIVYIVTFLTLFILLIDFFLPLLNV